MMLNFGERKTQLRKKQSPSQDELLKKDGVSRSIIGNYELNANSPSIQVLLKLAKVFNLNVDFLIGKGGLSSYDKEVMKWIDDIGRLGMGTKKHLFVRIDREIQNFKTRRAFF